jgi:KaiC/GvpD/RAD55 family RecA-like ATPase
VYLKMTPFVEYLQAGLSCIPVRADGSKAAAIPWHQYTKRLPTLEEAKEWATRYEGAAIIGGAVSGNLEILDLDEPTIVRPYIDALKAQDPDLLQKLCFIRTPARNESGQARAHAIYRCEEPVGGNTKLAMSELEPKVDDKGEPIINPATGEQNRKPRTLIETRGEGGYALTVGCSPKCHPTGRLYEHVYGRPLTDLETLTTSERNTLHTVARTFDRSLADTHREPQVRGYERAQPGESPGDDFNRRATWPEILEPHKWQAVGESGGLKRWRRPGKASGYSGVSGILSQQGNELLVVFSTNAYPFEGISQAGRPGVSYSRFGAYALLNHNGDYEAAAKALLKLGYGTPAKKTEHKARVLKSTVADAEKRYLDMLREGKTTLMSLGVPALDRAIGGGVEPGEVVIFGGLTSHGKTVCGLQALRATVESGRHGILVSHEMGALAIAKRMIASRTTLDSRRWFQYVDSLYRESIAYWQQCGELFLLEQCREIGAIETEIAQIASEYDVGLIVIDHAQLTIGKGTSRYEQLTYASGCFKGLAVKHDCVCLVLSQLNREAAKGGEQALHHLKETGALEQDADVVCLVKWPWKSDPNCDPKHYLFTVHKNRNRPIVQWQVEATFNPARQTIDAPRPDSGDLTPEENEAVDDFLGGNGYE